MTRLPDISAPGRATANPRWKLGETPWIPDGQAFAPAARVIVDNDFSGDPDDLYQLVHHLLSPGVEIAGIVCSHLRAGDVFDPSEAQASNAASVVRDVLARMGADGEDKVWVGSERAMEDVGTPQQSEAVDNIIHEALREDTSLPLFYAAGGGLTDLASALLIEPRIAERLTLVWIGGAEHEGLATPPPGAMPIEYNLLIDVTAGQVVFASDVEFWQVPRDAYRSCIATAVELRARVASVGALGKYLYDELSFVWEMVGPHGIGGETYVLGDQPLVLLTALRTLFEPDAASSAWVDIPRPALLADGSYRQREDSGTMRVMTGIDNRLVFEDFYLKLAEFVAWQELSR